MVNVLGDTNLPLRWAETRSLDHADALAARRRLKQRGDQMVFCPQVLVEFWCAATRPPGMNGLGLTPARADRHLKRLEYVFPLLVDTPEIFPEWRRLVREYGVCGRQVYDARLAATMRVHGVTHILTFNAIDFYRYPGITVIDPRELAREVG